MIPANAAQSAIAVVEQLEATNRRVVAVAGTPLAQLVAISSLQLQPSVAAVGVVDLNAAAQADYQPTASGIEAESRIESLAHDNLSQHDVLMDGLVTDLSQCVAQHLTFAKNTVRPLIKTFVDEAAAALASYPDQSTYSPQIVKLDLPEVSLLPAVEGEAVKFKDVVYIPLGSPLNLPPASGDAALRYLVSGSAALDNAVAAWVQAKGEDFFAKVYNVVFSSGAAGVTITPDQLYGDKLEGLDALTATFLMARHLLENAPEGAPYGLADYRIAVGTVVEQTGLRLANAFADRERNIALETLIVGSAKDVIYVFAPVYDKWIAEGGVLATLLGNMLLDRPNQTLAAMLQDQEQCMTRWEQQNRFLTVTLQNRKFDAAKDSLRFVTEKLAGENIQTIFGEIAPGQELTLQSPVVSQALDNAKGFIDFLDAEQIKDLWQIGVEVVAGSLFSYSAAFSILNSIEKAAKDNAGIDPNEAALLGTIDYVTNYVVDQIELRAL